MVQVNFSMDDELHARMKIYAAKYKINIKDLIPKAVEKFMKNKKS